MWYYHVSNPSIREAEAGPSLWVEGWPGLCSELVNPASKREWEKERERGHGSCVICVIITPESL